MTGLRASRSTTVLSRAAVLAAVIAATTAVADAFKVLALAGDILIPLWTVSLPSALAAVVLAGAAVLGSRQRRIPRPHRRRSRTGIALMSASVLATGMAVVATFTGVSAGTSAYTVLAPPSETGCRVAAVESSYFLEGRADLYAFGGGPVALAAPRASLEIDGGGAPVAAGIAALTWTTAGSAELDVPGARGGRHVVDCS